MTQTKAPQVNLKSYDFEMFTPEGNQAVGEAVARIFKKLELKTRYTKNQVFDLILAETGKVQKKHPEVNDSEPEYHIVKLVREKCQEIGYNYEFERFDVF